MYKNNFGCRKVISIKVDALSHNCLFSRCFDGSPIFFSSYIYKSLNLECFLNFGCSEAPLSVMKLKIFSPSWQLFQ